MSDKKYLRIELLSDMCCGTGEGNGSNVDICTTFDEYGLPIIPGKRLKGLLRENAVLLMKYGQGNENIINSIFGNIRGYRGKLRVNNAHVINSQSIKNDLARLSAEMSAIVTRQAISETFTSIRTQTAVDKDGIVKDLSLRSIQVIKMGTVFVAEISLNNGTTEEWSYLKKCLQLLRSIGLNKTRGFGEIQCSCSDNNELVDNQEHHPKSDYVVKPSIGFGKLDNNEETVAYTVKLLDDVVISAGANYPPDYLSGSMLQGAIARYASAKSWFTDAVLKKTRFSNAYVSDGVNYYYPTPLSLKLEKNKDSMVYSLADNYQRDEKKQYVPARDYYYQDEKAMYKLSVDSSYEYHYSVGGEEIPKNLFTFRKLNKGQFFCGTITADRKSLDLIITLIQGHNNLLYFGGSATAQYAAGRIDFNQTKQYCKVVDIKDIMVIQFLSDVILTDKNGFNSGNVECLTKAVREIIEFDSCQVYTKTLVTGGFNAKWKLPKQQYIAFSKGTVLRLQGCKGKKTSAGGYIGLRNSEGYGQYIVRPLEKENSFVLIQRENVSAADNEIISDYAQLCGETKAIINNVLLHYYKEQIISKALTAANNLMKAKSQEKRELSASCAMRMFTAYRSLSDKHDLKKEMSKYINKNFSSNENLRGFGEEVIAKYEEEIIGFRFTDQILISAHTKVINNDRNKDLLFTTYFRAFLAQVIRNYQQIKKGLKGVQQGE